MSITPQKKAQTTSSSTSPEKTIYWKIIEVDATYETDINNLFVTMENERTKERKQGVFEKKFLLGTSNVAAFQ